MINDADSKGCGYDIMVTFNQQGPWVVSGCRATVKSQTAVAEHQATWWAPRRDEYTWWCFLQFVSPGNLADGLNAGLGLLSNSNTAVNGNQF